MTDASARAKGPSDSFGARLALKSGPLLARFNSAGTLDAADVQVARRLGAMTGEQHETVLLAAALAVRAVRTGSVCARLDDLPGPDDAGPDDAGRDLAGPDDAGRDDDLPWPEPVAWQEAILASPMFAIGPTGPADRPVRWIGGRIYLDRYWRDEQLVRAEIDTRLAAPLIYLDPELLRAGIHEFFPAPEDARQRLAAATTASSRLAVLTGGPGTGKTTTVARIVAILRTVSDPGMRVALAAPTGKAAARLQEAVNAELGRITPTRRSAGDGALVEPSTGTPFEATTIHRLLGWRRDSSTRFRHDRTRQLPHDLVVVDESSMVSLPLMARLLEALRPQTRLLLVGDPDQLASVEAGAVLGDLVARPPVSDQLPDRLGAILPGDLDGSTHALRNGVVRLTVSHRYGAELGRLAEAIRVGDDAQVMALLRRGDEAVEFVETAENAPTAHDVAGLRAEIEHVGTTLVTAARNGDAAAALGALNDHRLLLAHRRGPTGVALWSARAQAWVSNVTGADLEAPWQPGLPLMVKANDRTTGLSNGDTGVVLTDPEGDRVVAFGDPKSPFLVRPHRLPEVEPVLAMTVHKAQGSQFGSVSVLLPGAGSRLLTRELLYTAITRARQRVRIIGTEAAVRAAVGRPIRRASGLREPLP